MRLIHFKKLVASLTLVLIVGTCVYAQTTGLTIDQVEAQVVALQTLTSPTPTGVTQPPTLADQIIALQTLTAITPAGVTQPPTLVDQIIALAKSINCLANYKTTTLANFNAIFGAPAAPAGMITLPALSNTVTTLNGQVQTQALQLSTVGTLTQLGLDNQTNIQSLQAEVTALQAAVAALSPAAAAKLKHPPLSKTVRSPVFPIPPRPFPLPSK
jgi:hypothetical protein